MTNVEKIKLYYEKGIYKDKHLQIFLEKGVLTQEQYEEIKGGR